MVENIKTRQNAHKMVYLLKQFPEHKLPDLISLFITMPKIDVNAALWYAVEAGYITEPDKETGVIKVLKQPKVWSFGEDLDSLDETLRYAFEKLSEQQKDLEEYEIGQWCNGYAPHDTMILLKQLLNKKFITQYQLKDNAPKKKKAREIYTFYTLAENKGKYLAKKRFKDQSKVEVIE